MSWLKAAVVAPTNIMHFEDSPFLLDASYMTYR
jgi:hypothetical protein